MKKLTLTLAIIFSVLLCTGQKINKAEYFIDSDPGYGLAIPIPISTPGKVLSLSFQVNATGLSQGFHMMVLRARDDKGYWSNTRQQVFYVYQIQNVTESKINKAEYFIDNDPGFGLAVPIPVSTPAKRLSLSFNVNASGLSQGFHMMVLRARDQLNRWSNSRQQVFYVYQIQNVAESKINKAEYFIDNDPGFGLAVPIPVIIPAKRVSLSFNVNVSGFSEGFHMMVLRAHDQLGHWSNTRQQVFYVYKVQSATVAKINKAEYFIDSDPGFGKAVPVPVSIPGKRVSLSFNVNASGLSQGFHMMVVRAHDELGRWSNTRQQVFYLYKAIPPVSSNITGIEYFIDTDPGFGKGTPVSVAVPGSRVTADFIANLNGLTSGDHIIYIRAKDALKRWSHYFAQAFTLTISDFAKEEVVSWFRIYPNPNEGNFKIDFADLQNRPIKITINDLNGRTVYSNELEGEIISLSVDLPDGTYLLTVESGNQHFNQKLIIRR